MCKMVKNRYRDAFGYCNTTRKELSKQNKTAKLDNELTPEEEKKYISYEELMSVPGKVSKVLNETYGKIFLCRSEFEQLAKAKRTDYLKLVFDYITLWLNVHYPLRLVWPSVMLTPEVTKSGSPLRGSEGARSDQRSPDTSEQPSKLLWRIFNRQPGEYDYPSSSNSFSQVISKLFMKYNGKPMSMNMIRHIAESHLIQSPTYAKLTNREKNDLHAKLLHSNMAANTSYNKIANRSNASKQIASVEPDTSFEPDASFEPEPVPVAKPAAKTPSRPRDRRERIFHGDFTPSAGPFHVEFHGLQACLRSDKSQVNIKTMLVSHAFVDLWWLIREDRQFNKALFDLLDEQERDFMRYCLNKCKITS
ncbi:unnamed protein product [Phytophthora lilii]|uniref:Unnamed protein product n=1 Tax=Phytophthora lilii TaxID=2077276 RepID=A0A9W6U1Y5_9STRA|nr:unnamed protein product [Phytophthora lilii]